MPPEAPEGSRDTVGDMPPAASVFVTVLKNRSDFLKAAKSNRVVTDGFILQTRKRNPDEASGIRVGFTCSKKVGNAVARNRAKRRLREIARLVLPQDGHDGFDYVLIGRKAATATLDFAKLQADLRRALTKVHP